MTSRDTLNNTQRRTNANKKLTHCCHTVYISSDRGEYVLFVEQDSCRRLVRALSTSTVHLESTPSCRLSLTTSTKAELVHIFLLPDNNNSSSNNNNINIVGGFLITFSACTLHYSGLLNQCSELSLDSIPSTAASLLRIS